MIKRIISPLFLLFILYNLESAPLVKVFYEKINPCEYAFYADNDNFCPFQILIKITPGQDLTSDTRMPFYTVIDQQKKKKYLFSIFPKSPNENMKIKYSAYFAFGDPSLTNIYDEHYPYFFPFENGKSYKVTQGFNTRGTHSGRSKYSVDFGMNIGTPVCASRDGVVVAIKDDSKLGGPYYKYRYQANYVIIYHYDGTFSEYMHLNFSGSNVQIGDIVKAGDIIGFSGNTGYSRGPHLHFMVFRPVFMTSMTIPIKFLSRDGNLLTPVLKNFYVSNHYFNNEIITETETFVSEKSSLETDSTSAVGGP